MATIVQGEDLMLFVSGVSVACATNHTLTISTETSDTSHKDIRGSWTSSQVKKFSWEISTENLFSTDGQGKAYDDLFGYMTNKTELTVAFGTPASYTGSTAPTGGFTPGSSVYTGKAIITNLQLNAPNGDNATYTATLTGVGALTKAS